MRSPIHSGEGLLLLSSPAIVPVRFARSKQKRKRDNNWVTQWDGNDGAYVDNAGKTEGTLREWLEECSKARPTLLVSIQSIHSFISPNHSTTDNRQMDNLWQHCREAHKIGRLLHWKPPNLAGAFWIRALTRRGGFGCTYRQWIDCAVSATHFFWAK